MAITQQLENGTGSQTQYTLLFPYVAVEDVKVTIGGVLQDQDDPTEGYEVNGEILTFLTPPPAGIDNIKIYRETDVESLRATFFAGSAIRASDLNENFITTLYAAQESNFIADTATATAEDAVATAETAEANSITAVSNSNAAVSTANAAEATANTAETNSLAAVATANSAASDAATAVSIANAAVADATSAVNTANSAEATADQAALDAVSAINTANAAAADAATAIATADQAALDAAAAVSTANSAEATANNAEATANNAEATANNAETTAIAASADAANAIAAIAAAALYVVIADVAAIPGSPSNGDGVQIVDSTGIESFTPLNGLPVGFVGDPGLFVRLRYDGSALAWDWVEYQANDPDDRYATQAYVDNGDAAKLDLTGGTMSGAIDMGSNLINNVTDPSSAQDAATKNYVDTALSGLSQHSISQSNSNVTVTDDGVADGEVRVSVDGATAIYFATNGTNAYTSTFHHNSISLVDQNELAFMEAAGNGTNAVGFKAPASIASDVTWTLPAADGTSGQNLTTDGSGTLSWTSPSNPALIIDGDSKVQVNDNTPSASYIATQVDGVEVTYTTFDGIELLDQKDLKFYEDNANGTNYLAFKAPATVAANVIWTLPAADATVAGHALKSDAAGNLSWGTAGGATGGGTDDVFYENSQTVTTNYTLTAGKNAMTAGPVTINSGVTVTVPSGQSWSIV